MRKDKDFLDILACPLDKEPLELTIEEEIGDEVIQGYSHLQTVRRALPDRGPHPESPAAGAAQGLHLGRRWTDLSVRGLSS